MKSTSEEKRLIDSAFDKVKHIPITKEVSYHGQDAIVIARELSFKNRKDAIWKITLSIIPSGRQVVCDPSEVKERRIERAAIISRGMGM